MIGAETGAGVTVTTICNYDRYQLGAVNDGAASDAENGADSGARVAQERRRKEEGKKERKDNTRFRAGEPEGFAEWYAGYPRKKQRKDAERAFAKLMKAGEISKADLMARTLAFAATWSARPKADLAFCPYPASWLNSGEYLDTPEPVASGGNNGLFKIEEPTRRDRKTFTESDWHDCLTAFKNQGRWPETYWGPPPGQPGCLVPGRLLVAPAEPTRTTGAANG